MAIDVNPKTTHTFQLTDSDECKIEIKFHEDGGIILKQGSDIVYVTPSLAGAVRRLLQEG